jgi:hypothetical protein
MRSRKFCAAWMCSEFIQLRGWLVAAADLKGFLAASRPFSAISVMRTSSRNLASYIVITTLIFTYSGHILAFC